jgi:hypothetical protein
VWGAGQGAERSICIVIRTARGCEYTNSLAPPGTACCLGRAGPLPSQRRPTRTAPPGLHVHTNDGGGRGVLQSADVVSDLSTC